MHPVTIAVLGALAVVLTAFAAAFATRAWLRGQTAPSAAPEIPHAIVSQPPFQTPSQEWWDQLQSLTNRFNELHGECMAALDAAEREKRQAKASEERNRQRLAKHGELEEDAPFDPRQLQLVEDEPDEQSGGPPPMDARRRRLEERRSRAGGG